jgi:hypothetical protein
MKCKCGHSLNEDASICVMCGNIVKKKIELNIASLLFLYIMAALIPYVGIGEAIVLACLGKRKHPILITLVSVVFWCMWYYANEGME